MMRLKTFRWILVAIVLIQIFVFVEPPMAKASLSETAVTIIAIEAAEHHLGDGPGNEGTVFEKSFTLDCTLTISVLTFDIMGPNYEEPPRIFINKKALQSLNGSFPQVDFSDPIWQTNGDGSHDYSGKFHVILPASVGQLQVGKNTFRIENGRPDDDYYFSNVQIEGICNKTIQITSVSNNSFIVPDSITLTATTVPNVDVRWTVVGLDAAKGIAGFPKNEIHRADANGISTFTFTPSANKVLVKDRHTKWTKGNYSPNPPISFEVIASVTINRQEFESRLSQAGLGSLRQDEIDILRQEYYDYGFPKKDKKGHLLPIPSRDKVVPSLGTLYNQGPYTVQLSKDSPRLYNEVLAAYRGQQRVINVLINGKYYKVSTTIPDTATVTITSAYRNPQRNKTIDGASTTSIHMFGGALDLVPDPVTLSVNVPVNGKIVTQEVNLNLRGTLYPALLAAANVSGKYAFYDRKGKKVLVGQATHVHVNWSE